MLILNEKEAQYVLGLVIENKLRDPLMTKAIKAAHRRQNSKVAQREFDFDVRMTRFESRLTIEMKRALE